MATSLARLEFEFENKIYRRPRIITIRCKGLKLNPVGFFLISVFVYCTKLGINDHHVSGKKTIEAIFEIPFLSRDTGHFISFFDP